MFFFRKNKKMNYIEYYKSLPSTMLYTDDHEYRNVIRKIFQFDPDAKFSYDGQLRPSNELDPISKDEVSFDSDKISNSMDEIYKATSECIHFKDLYISAAATMLSTCPEIGHAVLSSYDHLYKFHSCVWHYLHGGEYSLCSCKEFNDLKRHFSSK